MITLQFIAYNLTVLFVVLHFMDSAKETEWTEPIYRNSYPLWLISSAVLIVVALAGIVPVYLGNTAGQVLSYIVGIGGIGAAGYHIPMQQWNGSEVCRNRLSYWLMYILTFFSIALLATTIVSI